MPPLTHRALIELAAAGDRQAFRQLVMEHQSFVYSLCYRFVGNRDDAQDLTQEAFIRLWKNLKKYNPEYKLTTWFYKIVSNLCLDHLKSTHARQKKRMEKTDDLEVADNITADQNLLDTEFRDAVITMANALTPVQKAVFILRDLEALTVEEVCSSLSMTSGNVKSNLYYARKKMSERLATFYQIKKTEL